MKLTVFLLVIIFKLTSAWQDDPKCGLQTVDLLPETQIVGGQPAQEGEYPWQAALYSGGYRICGASLVTPNWLITAAHCVNAFQDSSSYELMLGSNSLNNISENSQRLPCSEFYVHPLYGEPGDSIYDWDMALMKVERPFEITDYVRTVCVPQKSQEDDFGAGKAVTITGWGTTYEGGPQNPDLFEVTVPVVDQQKCKDNYAPEPITDDMICAGLPEGGKDSCQGDSGGPLVGLIGDRWYLGGVVSWGQGCARPELPGVYTRVTEFEDWIAPIFDGGVPVLPDKTFALGNPPIDTPSRCANARRPENGHVKCCIDLSSFDDVDINSGGKSGGKSSGGHSSGGSSHGPDVYTCTYTCDVGFKLSGPSVLECPIDKITDNPTCEPVECEVLPAIDQGSLSCSDSFQYGSVCQYKCAVGFYISGGSSSLTCNKDGMWNGIVPTCQPVQCPALEEPNHGSLLCPNGRTFGSDCRYTCDNRYRLDGPSVATCAANGTWTSTGNRLPTCKLSECTPLPLLVHGSLTCTKGWDRGSLCSYSCHGGYTLTGGNYLLSCRASGFWRGDIPTCEADSSPRTTAPPTKFYTTKPRTTESPTQFYTTTPELPDYNTTTAFAPNTTTTISTPTKYSTTTPGNSTTNTEFALYDFSDGAGGRDGPSSIVGPDSGQGSDTASGGLNAAGIVAIVAVIVVLMGVSIGLFVAYRSTKHSQEGYGNL
ncbi:uncharacterized protein [Amphiura filiformis]